MVEEARLEAVDSGLAPVTAGWFVVNARDAAWLNNDYFGGICIFEADDFVLRGRPDLGERTFPAAGFTLRVVSPGQPAGLYQAETNQQEEVRRLAAREPRRLDRAALGEVAAGL
jgi:hypothetical protein